MFDQINLELKPSFSLSAIITAACLSAAILIGSRDIPLNLMFLLLMIFLGTNFYYVSLLGSLKLNNSITLIRLYQNEITLFDSKKQRFRASLSTNSFIAPWGCLLVFSSTTDKKTKIVLLSKQNIENINDFRRFRVWSKFGHSTQNNTALFE
ncbi:MAG: hypothetical protein ACI84K_000769 [Pseudohongiellaceae bacterium]|jgi:hypothetical protein